MYFTHTAGWPVSKYSTRLKKNFHGWVINDSHCCQDVSAPLSSSGHTVQPLDDELMQPTWNTDDKEQALETNLSQRQFVHYKCHNGWHGSNPGLRLHEIITVDSTVQ
jgi:hypothetical protein